MYGRSVTAVLSRALRIMCHGLEDNERTISLDGHTSTYSQSEHIAMRFNFVREVLHAKKLFTTFSLQLRESSKAMNLLS